MKWIIVILVILIIVVVYYYYFLKSNKTNTIPTITKPPQKLIINISDPDGIKNGNYEAVPCSDFFNKNSNYWNISVKFNLDNFNNTLQSIIGNLLENNITTQTTTPTSTQTTTPTSTQTTTPALTQTTTPTQIANNWGLWITPQRILRIIIGNLTSNFNSFGELKDNTPYLIDIIYDNKNYTITLINLDVNKNIDNFNIVNLEPIILRANPIITDSGFITIGGKMNNKFLGTISDVKSFDKIVATTPVPPTTTPIPIKQFFLLEDPEGIKNGKYRQISRNKFGLNSNNINRWNITIIFTPINANKYQGIIGNIYNISLPNTQDGWGFFISPAKYIHVRIQSWAHDLVLLDELISDIPYKLIINFNSYTNDNIGTYNIRLINMKDNIIRNTMIEEKKRLIGDKGRICIGGDWPENPNNERFNGIISFVEFSKVPNIITTTPKITTPKITTPQTTQTIPIVTSRTWSLDCNESNILINFAFKNKIALTLKITETSAELNSWDGQTWGSPVFISNTNIYADQRPLKLIIIFNVDNGFSIIYKSNKLITYQNMFYIENANDLTLQINPDSDIIIESNKVIIFLECNFNGTALELSPGSYGDAWLADRGFNDNINSIIIPDGMQVTVYSNAMWGGFQDVFGTYNNNVLCGLHSISGIIVRKI